MNTPTPETDAHDAKVRNAGGFLFPGDIDFMRKLERERDEAEGIVLACHRAFMGGSDFVQSEARRLSADLVARVTTRIQNTLTP